MDKIPYIRVGTFFYKKVQAPTISGHFSETLVPWNIETIREDHGVPKYDGFTCLPDHLNYQQIFRSFYKTYCALSTLPKEGIMKKTMFFIRHIFGSSRSWGWIIFSCYVPDLVRSFRSCAWYRGNRQQEKRPF